MEKICQSCSMPLCEEKLYGTNEDGSLNDEYCIYCFKDGGYEQNIPLDEYIEYSLQFSEMVGMTKEEMKEYCIKILPTLKRWKTTT